MGRERNVGKVKKKKWNFKSSGGGFFPMKLAEGCQIPRPVCVTEERACWAGMRVWWRKKVRFQKNLINIL